jgi:hypothetical protein
LHNPQGWGTPQRTIAVAFVVWNSIIAIMAGETTRKDGPPAEWSHGLQESVNPGQGSWLYQATDRAYDYFKNSNTPLPADFFSGLGGDTRAEEAGSLGVFLLRGIEAYEVASFAADFLESLY